VTCGNLPGVTLESRLAALVEDAGATAKVAVGFPQA